jgi:ABC-type antimicrobial peptide transport system permease subunit
LNIAGLAVGIACAALILLWVEDEVTYNKFPKQKQLYAVFQNQDFNGEISTSMTVPNPLADALKCEVPGIRNVMRHSNFPVRSLFTLDEKKLYETGYYSDASIFEMLDVTFVQGNATTAFDAASPIVITEQMAARFFGQENPVGQTIKRNNEQEYTVTAVIENPKQNSDFVYSWLIPFQQLVDRYLAMGWQDADITWNSTWLNIYVELEPTADVNQINLQIRDLKKRKTNDPNDRTALFLYPVSKLKLYGEFKDGFPAETGYIRYVRLFFWIAIIILIIACINFMNLSTARSQKRVLEVGVRKTFGAGRMTLVRQFMSESGVITLISMLFAVGLIVIALTPFNTLTGKQLSVGFDNPVHWIGLLSIGLICSILAGSFPAFFLSSFPPLDVLRRLKTGKNSGVIRLRQGLVVLQFAVSLTLIICTAFIYLQVRHAQNRSLGMDISQVIRSEANPEIQKQFEPLQHELLASGAVENVGLSSQTMLNLGSSVGGLNWTGKQEDAASMVYFLNVTETLFPTLHITLYEGRNFESGVDSNANNIIVNKAFADLMGEEGRVGGRLWQGADNENAYTIVGIINDFVFNDMYSSTQQPVIFQLSNSGSELFIRLKPGNIQSSLQKVETVVKEFAPSYPFEYQFMDEQFEQKFKSTLLVGQLAGLFAGLAIFISCLGLFGLVAFAAEQRTREIAIRKVLGASVSDIVILLGSNFAILTCISFVIAIPLAYWIILRWLQGFEYRIGMDWRVFAASGLLVIVIALLTVGYQALKAAMANPAMAIMSSE